MFGHYLASYCPAAARVRFRLVAVPRGRQPLGRCLVVCRWDDRGALGICPTEHPSHKPFDYKLVERDWVCFVIFFSLVERDAGLRSLPLHSSERVKGTTGLDVATNGDTARKNACATKAKTRGSGGRRTDSASGKNLPARLDPRYGFRIPRSQPQALRPVSLTAAALVSKAAVTRFLAPYLIHRSLDPISGPFAKRAARFWAARPSRRARRLRSLHPSKSIRGFECPLSNGVCARDVRNLQAP